MASDLNGKLFTIRSSQFIINNPIGIAAWAASVFSTGDVVLGLA